MTLSMFGETPSEPLQITDQWTDVTYEFTLSARPGGSETFRASCGPGHVRTLSRELRKIPVPCLDGRNFLRLERDERDKHLRAVARAGRELFRALCPTPAERELFRNMLAGREGEAIRAVMSAAAVPWEALCLAEDPDAAGYKDFLGWNHAVLRDTHRYAPITRGTSRDTNGLVRAGHISDDVLGSVISGRHVLALGCRPGEIAVDPLSALGGPSAVTAFRGFFADRNRLRQLYQLDCHVERGGSIESSHLRVSSDVAVPFYEFEKGRMIIYNGPFVLLNACEGGTVSEDTREGYAKRMREAGARSVLATEAKVGDDFAVEFAQTFYAVAGGSDLATALLKARRAVLAHDRNPGALFYGLYGDGEWDIALAEIDRGAVQEPVRERLDALDACWPPGGGNGDFPPSAGGEG